MTRIAITVALTAQWLAAQPPEQRAVDYLSAEVPRWSKENGCFSCHNNGDAARALYVASRRGYKVPREALADTTAWLIKPSDWDNNRGNPASSDKKLARIQFAGALVEAFDSKVAGDRRILVAAAESLLPYQDPDGSWQVDIASVGSPATYGIALATYMARRTLEAADPTRFKDAIDKADRWLRTSKPTSALGQAAVLMAIPAADPVARQCLDQLLRSQASDGGWGPYPLSPTEPFDTAVALISLQKLNQPEPIARGRAFLIAQQERSGGWPETTRPPGNKSYAEHISTTGWATLALILTDPKR